MGFVRNDWDPTNHNATDNPGCHRAIEKLVQYGGDIASHPTYKGWLGDNGVKHITRQLREFTEETMIAFECKKPSFEHWLMFAAAYEDEFAKHIKKLLDSLMNGGEHYSSFNGVFLIRRLQGPLLEALDRE